MFGPRLSLTIHLISYIGTIVFGTGAILTPTVFFDYYKQQNRMTDEDAKAFDMITGVLTGASFGLIMNLCCLQRRGVVLSLRKSWRESCFRSAMVTTAAAAGSSAVVPTGEIFDIGIDAVNKNPIHYYIPKISNVRNSTSVATIPSSSKIKPKQVRHTYAFGSSYNTNMKRSYMKREFPPVRDIRSYRESDGTV